MRDEPDAAQNFAAALNGSLEGWNAAMGLCFVSASADEVVVEWEVRGVHKQPYGLVHGGVHAGIIETIASVGAAIHAASHGQSVVGLENHTSFLKAVRGGKLRATARPLSRGRRTQVWEGSVTDEAGRVVATGRVRLLSLDAQASLAGEIVEIKPSGE